MPRPLLSLLAIDPVTGHARGGATLTVYLTGSTTPASLFEFDDATARVNPHSLDAAGRSEFRIAQGLYDCQVSGGDFSTFLMREVPAGVATFNDVEGEPSIVVGPTPADGISSYASRRDHVHGFAAFSDAEGDPANLGTSAADGTSAFAARRDHVHSTTLPSDPVSPMQAATKQYVDASGAAPGAGKLVKSGADLKFLPKNGTRLVVNGTVRTIPAAGVTLAPTSLTPDTLYYIYAFWNGAALALEASATTHATHTDGVEIKNGDASRTLVGMARTITGPAWVDTDEQRLVLSYYNRGTIRGRSTFSANRSTASATFVELNTEIRVEFLTWGDEAQILSANVAVNSAAGDPKSAIGIDGANVREISVISASSSGSSATGAAVGALMETEGYHVATLLGHTSGGVNGTWRGSATAGERCSLHVIVRG